MTNFIPLNEIRTVQTDKTGTFSTKGKENIFVPVIILELTSVFNSNDHGHFNSIQKQIRKLAAQGEFLIANPVK